MKAVQWPAPPGCGGGVLRWRRHWRVDLWQRPMGLVQPTAPGGVVVIFRGGSIFRGGGGNDGVGAAGWLMMSTLLSPERTTVPSGMRDGRLALRVSGGGCCLCQALPGSTYRLVLLCAVSGFGVGR